MKTFLLILTFLLPIAAGAMDYTTTFPANERPISESGNWLNGKTTGLDWSDVYTTNHFAYGTEDPQSGAYDDATAILTGTWGTNQSATAVVKINGSDANILGEVEIRLNSSVSAHVCNGYEGYISIKPGNAYSHIAIWNGAIGSYANLVDGSGYAVNGDTLVFTRSNSVLRLYKNGSLLCSATDTTFMHGAPGIGFYNSSGTVGVGGNTNFAFSSFTATDGLSNAPAGAGQFHSIQFLKTRGGLR